MRNAVPDTNVVIAAMRSRHGASFGLLRQIGDSWSPLISVSLILEYEAIGFREAARLGIPKTTIDLIVQAFCFYGRGIPIYFRVRRRLTKDEFVLELAAAGGAEAIVTYNRQHFMEAADSVLPC